MHQPESKGERKRRYEPPVLLEVHVDPQRELLMQTTCAQVANQGVPACDSSPGT